MGLWNSLTNLLSKKEPFDLLKYEKLEGDEKSKYLEKHAKEVFEYLPFDLLTYEKLQANDKTEYVAKHAKEVCKYLTTYNSKTFYDKPLAESLQNDFIKIIDNNLDKSENNVKNNVKNNVNYNVIFNNFKYIEQKYSIKPEALFNYITKAEVKNDKVMLNGYDVKFNKILVEALQAAESFEHFKGMSDRGYSNTTIERLNTPPETPKAPTVQNPKPEVKKSVEAPTVQNPKPEVKKSVEAPTVQNPKPQSQLLPPKAKAYVKLLSSGRLMFGNFNSNSADNQKAIDTSKTKGKGQVQQRS